MREGWNGWCYWFYDKGEMSNMTVEEMAASDED